MTGTCVHSGMLPVLEIHGTDDIITLYNGNPTGAYGWGPDERRLTVLRDRRPDERSTVFFERDSILGP